MSVQKARRGYRLVEDFFGRSYEIPYDWDYPSFSDVVKVNPLTKINDEKVPYLPMDAIDVEKPHFSYFEERSLKEFPSLPKFQEHDVLFASITPSTENGKTCIIENFSRKGIGSSELTVLRPTDKVVPRYLYYYVKSHRIRQFAISQMMGTTGRQRVPDYVFKKDLNFELPPIQEQQKIASILSNVDSLINQTQKIIEQTQRLKKGLMQRLLTKGIGNTKFRKVKWYFGKDLQIPEDWLITKISEVTSRIMKGIFDLNPENYVANGIPFLRVSDIENNVLTLSNTVYISDDISKKFNSSELSSGDIVLAKVGSIYSNDKIAQIPKNIPKCNISQNMIGIKMSNNRITSNYLLLELRRNYNIIVSLSNATTLGALRLDTIRELKIPLPSLQEQQKITSILSNIDSQIRRQQEYKFKLETLKKGLMQKLLTGQIRVSV